jgi:hypothetical protein
MSPKGQRYLTPATILLAIEIGSVFANSGVAGDVSTRVRVQTNVWTDECRDASTIPLPTLGVSESITG